MNMTNNILLIQGNAADAKTVQDALLASSNFHVEQVDTFALGLQRLAALGKQNQPEATGIGAILVDLQLPDIAGIEIFDRLFAVVPQIPILILSSSQDEEIAKAAVQRGAQDYLLKSRLDDYLLPKALAGVIDRAANTEALFDEKERAQVTLNSIGDAVISTDVAGRIAYLNVVAEKLTGWPSVDAVGQPLETVMRLIDAESRATIPNPMAIATQRNQIVGLPPTCILIRRDGVESAIEDSVAPIHNRRGEVTGAVMVFHDVSTSRAMSQKLEHLANYDSLTDLPNRTLLNDRIARAAAAVNRHHTALAILYLDLDRFKHINDSFGHSGGDRMLQAVAQRLRECVRASDTVSRIGGDEFVVLLSEVKHADAAAICADKILRALGMPYLMDAFEMHITASIGIAVYPGDGAGLETLLQNADSSMYEAKNHGRNNYQFYRTDLNSTATERQSMENGLRHAIEREELDVHYQPIIDLTTGAIVGAEALLRWENASLGSVSPTQFIEVAEESGLIVPLGAWALRKACAQFSACQITRLRGIRLAVNVSAVELRSKDFVARVAAILAETGIDPQCLELEITETFIMQDSKATATVLNALKSLGVTLALDDFGTGYSSLSYMRRFPIDTLKIDRSFVRDLTTDADDASVVSAIINMGKSLHMRVVAEGVETREQLKFLKENRCAEAQGYYLNRPMKAERFANLLCQASADASPNGLAAARRVPSIVHGAPPLP